MNKQALSVTPGRLTPGPTCTLGLVISDGHSFAHLNHTVGEHLTEDAAAAVGCKRRAKARELFVHEPTWLGLTVDKEPHFTDCYLPVNRQGEVEAFDRQVGAPRCEVARVRGVGNVIIVDVVLTGVPHFVAVEIGLVGVCDFQAVSRPMHGSQPSHI